jgi:hypothetical protein
VFRTALGRGQAAVMVGATTAALTVMEQVLVAVWAGALESTACSVKLARISHKPAISGRNCR